MSRRRCSPSHEIASAAALGRDARVVEVRRPAPTTVRTRPPFVP